MPKFSCRVVGGHSLTYHGVIATCPSNAAEHYAAIAEEENLEGVDDERIWMHECIIEVRDEDEIQYLYKVYRTFKAFSWGKR